jgi:predicted HicB family RNase H-like nuclease
MKEERKSPKAIYIRIADEVHLIAKTRAAETGITLEKWVLRAIMDKIKNEKK